MWQEKETFNLNPFSVSHHCHFIAVPWMLSPGFKPHFVSWSSVFFLLYHCTQKNTQRHKKWLLVFTKTTVHFILVFSCHSAACSYGGECLQGWFNHCWTRPDSVTIFLYLISGLWLEQTLFFFFHTVKMCDDDASEGTKMWVLWVQNITCTG